MPKDYKETLNLPRTDFPMKANLTQKELEILRFWEEGQVYKKIQEKNMGKPQYILHDGPPYANGHIHIGHALNKILKDIIVKYRAMKGFYAPYVPGWDCHGLPIELQVDKNLGDRKDKLNILEKRKLCKEYAEKFVFIQRTEFRRLGVFGDWDRPYMTMNSEYEAAIVREFAKFVAGGFVYRGKKPVYWCPSCATALAEAEVEYGDKESPSIFVKFKIDEENVAKFLPELEGKKVFVLIWTTTPWTLPANLALAFHPDFDYVAVQNNEEFYIVAEGRLETLREETDIKGKIIARMPGRNFEGMQALHPFLPKKSIAVLGKFVTLGEGTGIVHIAPGHGEDDYETALIYGLDIYAPVDRKGRFKFPAGEELSWLQGKFVFTANSEIIDMLKNNNALLKEEKIIHSYPLCWRCKKPVIFRATEQWFISLDRNMLRDRCLSEIDNVTWIPEWGKDRIYGMVRNRPDWCISRQRAWGVPITLLKCADCEEFSTDYNILVNIAEMVRKHGSDIWYLKAAEDFLPPEYRCSKCKGTTFSKETDILDVWFDSGISHAAVMEEDERLSWPANLYLEGSDQHRGWFQSSLLTSVGVRQKAPFGMVLTHGFVVDGQGKKMSKSLGNVISPQEVIKTDGAEILRLWVSAEDYREDIRISKEIIDRLTEAYRKIRNTCRFLLSNIYDFDGKDYSGDLLDIDKWAMSRLQTFTEKVTSAFENFNFHEVFHDIYNFCVVDMSSFYLDVLKDRLYTFKSDSPQRRAAQWVICSVLSVMTRLMAPVISFTAEEVWQALRKNGSEGRDLRKVEESVFLSEFPKIDERYHDRELEERWNLLFEVRNEVNKAIERKRSERLLGNSLEAKVTIRAPADYHRLLSLHRDFLPTFFIVSAVEMTEGNMKGSYQSAEIEGLEINIERAPGEKCQRCWNWSESVGVFSDAPEICERCYRVLFMK
ncbi:MAG: isoleucine--tRNA ligase [Nitrospirota bacterium]